MKLSNLLAATAFGLLVGATAASAAPLHPRIAEVNDRIVHQDHRIVRDFHDRRIGFIRAERLRARERMIRHQEVRMILRDHGHLTHHETLRLNREENRLGRRL